MRPKIVLVIMLTAVLALGLLVVLRVGLTKRISGQGAMAGSVNEASETAAVPGIFTTNAESGTTGTQPRPLVTNIVATTPDEDRLEAAAAAMERLKLALLDDGANPQVVEEVREQLLHSDVEVRKAAVETLIHLHDRGAIPKLKEALAKVEDPREKVGIMDAIEYLEIPEAEGQMTGLLNSAEASDMPSAAGYPTAIRPRAVKKETTKSPK